MKRVLAFLVLLSHMNYSMFVPQTDETDTFDASGQQTADINTLYEYVDEVVLGHKEPNTQDEDDDNARYFHVTKLDTYIACQQVVEADTEQYTISHTTKYPPCIEHLISPPDSDIQSPPPEV